MIPEEESKDRFLRLSVADYHWHMGTEEMTQEENNFGEKENKDSQIGQHLWISYCVQ